MNGYRGTVLYDPARCFNGYTLWSSLETIMTGADKAGDFPGKTYLMDMHGNTVHEWTLPFPPFYAYLLPDGHLLAGLRCTEDPDGQRPGLPPHGMGGTLGWIMELDWEGNIVFQHKDLASHHDFKKLPNGNYIYVAWERLDEASARKVRGGMKGTEHADGAIWSDVLREVDPQGRIVWEWRAHEHLDFEKDAIGPIHTREEWSHINDLWVCENGDIVSSSRHLDEVLRIERKTGDIVWRWGSPLYIDEDGVQMRHSDSTLGGPHDAHIIPEGLPGAGNMLCYDNGMYTYRSRAVEVDVETGEVVWQSTKAPSYIQGRVPFSPYISGARRMANGNTVICEGANGHFYEVTPEQDVVWDWWRPVPGDNPTAWAVFRCFRYAPDFCPQFASLPPAEGDPIG